MKQDKYIRQIALPQVGEQGQQKLHQARVLVIGAGGLGNAVLPYLASSGIGAIGIVDGDAVSLSNLHRQVLFAETDIGQPKAEVAQKKLSAQFPETEIEAYNTFLSGENALDLFAGYDMIVDATDSIAIRYLINDACVLSKKPFVHASVYRFQFQVAVFNVEQSGTYRCLYPNPPKTVQNCAEAGVMPTTVALAGLFQCNEVLKYLLNLGELLTNEVMLFDVLQNQEERFKYQPKDHSFVTEAFFYESYQEVELTAFANVREDGLLLDVREVDELPELSIKNYLQLPLSELENNLADISREKPIYIFCQTGKRSKQAYQLLKQQKFDQVFCLIENAPEINKLISTDL
jgi:molybdopterin/thiamine biosynthesis adenylyltransferase/rhodanese-related sulfurtransferase